MLELSFTPFPVLETPRLRLRAIVPGDEEALFRLRSDPQVMRHIGRPLARTREDAAKLMRAMEESSAEKTGIVWAIALREAGELAGTIGFWRIQAEHHHGELGYLLSPSLWGRGIAREAAEAVVAHGFAKLGFHRIEACVEPGNAASIRLLERIGFAREAHLRENFCFEGKFFDTLVYALLRHAKRGAAE